VDWLIEANVLEKHAVSIFRAKMMSWDSEGFYRYICVCVRVRAQWQEGRLKVRSNQEE
jgi:hypothetical protein